MNSATEYSFKIKVKNDPPILSEALKDQRVVYQIQSTYDIPTILDPEDMPLALYFESDGSGSSFIKL